MFFYDKTLKYDDKNANNYDEKFFYSDYSIYICLIKLKDMEYNKTLMLISLKYAKEVLNKAGDKQEDGTIIFDGRIYTITKNSVSSSPL